MTDQGFRKSMRLFVLLTALSTMTVAFALYLALVLLGVH